MTVDAIIVGSGPGGATAADVLTRAGWTVTIIEKGRNHLIDPDDPSQLAQDYSNDEIKFLHRHFLGPDPLIEPRTFRIREEDGERSYVGAVNSIPSTVGGGGTHADGKVPRFRPDDFRLLSTYGPIEGAAVADWPLDYDELEPYYAEVERLIGVAGTAGANPFAAWRSGPYPMPSGAPDVRRRAVVGGGRTSGTASLPGPTAANSVPYDGRPACNNCGHCAYFGCPIHAKGDPVAMLQHALGTGRAELLSETFVSRIRTNGRRATGVDVIGPDGVERSLGRPLRHRGRRRHRDAATASAVGDRAPSHRSPSHDAFPDDERGDHARAPACPQGPVGHPPPRRLHDRRRRRPGRGRGRRAALDPGRSGGARRRRPSRSWRASSTRGARSHKKLMAESPAARPAVGLHHAGRGPAPAHQPGRSRSDRPRRAGLSRGPDHLPTPPSRTGGLGPPRTAPHPGARRHGSHLDGHHDVASGRGRH